jgi:hypothetical protein
MKPGLTPRGEPTPQTAEEWRHLASLHEKALRQDAMTIGKLKHRINKLEQRSPEWISVEDQLPCHGKLVLATYKDCGSRQCTIIGFYYERFKEESCSDESYDEYCEKSDMYFYCEGWYEQQLNWGEYASIHVDEGNVTHWMELPKPPKE